MDVAAAVVVNLYAGRDCSIFRNGQCLFWRNLENSISGRVMHGAHHSGQSSVWVAHAHKI